MTEAKPDRLLGAAIGASAAPAAMLGAGWSALAASGPGEWALAFAAGALLGSSTWEVFLGEREPGPGYGALFGACAGLLSGALVGGPVGGVFGCCGGALAGSGVTQARRLVRQRSAALQFASLALLGSAIASGAAWGMTQ